MMSSEPFVVRVRALRDAWKDHRAVKALATSHEFEPQYRLLLTIHRWAEEAVAGIREVYGDTLSVTVGPAPDREPTPAFQFVIEYAYMVRFGLQQRRRMGSPRWHIAVAVTAGPEAGVVAAGPERRTGQWSRARMEDLLLGVLGAYERSVSDSLGSEGSAQAQAGGA